MKNIKMMETLVTIILTLQSKYCSNKSKFENTVKPVLSGHLKIDKIKVLIENGS